MIQLKTIILSLLAALSLSTAAMAEVGGTTLSPRNDKATSANSTDIKVQSGEKWWGLVVDPSNITLPFEMPFTINTSTLAPTLYKANVMLSNRGRYLWSESPMVVSFDGKKFTVTAEGKDAVAPKVQKSGRTLREAYLMCCHKNFPPQEVAVPELLFGSPIYEFGGTDALLYGQQDVLAFADMLVGRGAPSGTILLPMGWNSPSGAPAFDLEAYPNPKDMVAQLHAKGMKVMLTVTPYVMAAGRGYQQLRRDGGLICEPSGEPTVFQTGLGYTACRDITPQSAKDINAALHTLQTEVGIDGFYLDCLDALPLMGNQPDKLENFLTTWHSVADGLGAVVLSTPSAHPLGEVASTVTTERLASWQSLGRSLETAVEASVLGFTRTCVAAGLDFPACGKGNPGWNERLVLRTAQLAAMLPVAIIPYALWSIDDQEAVKELLEWRASMGPYYLELAHQATTSAEPIVRHLEYQFPRTGFTNSRDQFMIGDRYLVAPVVDDGTRRMVRLPKGRWQDQSGRTIKGPRVIDADVSGGKMAIFKAVK